MKPSPWADEDAEARMRAGLASMLRQARERRLLDLYDVRVTVEGGAPPEAAEVAGRLREMVAAIEPEPEVVMVEPKRNRRQRRRAAARAKARVS